MKHYIGEVGTEIILDTGITVTGASVLRINYRKPDGTTGYWTGASYQTTKVKYVLVANDISVAGTWSFQAYTEIGTGKWFGETAQIVFSSLFDQSSFCSLKTVKAMLSLSDVQKDDDDLLEGLIMQETKFIQNYCRRDFFFGNYTEYYDGGGQKLFLDNYPVTTISSINDDDERAFGNDTIIESTNYYLDADNGIVSFLENLETSEGSGNVKVVYSGGFSVIPSDLELACAQRVVADYIELKGGINAMEGETLTYKPGNLRKVAVETLDRYRKII